VSELIEHLAAGLARRGGNNASTNTANKLAG